MTQILKRKSRIPNRKRKASQIKRKRFDFECPYTGVAVIIMSTSCNLGLNNFTWVFQLQRRMKIAELKQISSRPDVVEVRIVDAWLNYLGAISG